MPFGTDRRLKPALVQGQNVTTLHRNKGRSGRTRSTQGWRTDIPRVRHSHRSRPNRSHHPQLTNPIRSHNEIGSRAALKEDICHQCQNELDSKQISKQIPSAHINYARLGQTVAFPHNRFGLDVTRQASRRFARKVLAVAKQRPNQQVFGSQLATVRRPAKTAQTPLRCGRHHRARQTRTLRHSPQRSEPCELCTGNHLR